MSPYPVTRPLDYSRHPTCLKISSSSLRLLSSTCRRPLSSASRIRRWRSASMENAWILRSSCRRISSLLRKSSVSPSEDPSSCDIASSTSSSWSNDTSIYQYNVSVYRMFWVWSMQDHNKLLNNEIDNSITKENNFAMYYFCVCFEQILQKTKSVYETWIYMCLGRQQSQSIYFHYKSHNQGHIDLGVIWIKGFH